MWAVRLFRTRAESAAACRSGHVRVDGRPAKAATAVAVGDRVEARVHGVDRTVEVTRVIEKRVGASVADGCLVDHTPPLPEVDRVPPSGAGRPTKRDRRQTDRLRARDDD
jgi:ribosome-associated heat shock protein Hsp15